MSAVHCPFCSEVLLDPHLERCPTCGMFVPPEVQTLLRARLESQQQQTSSPKSVQMDQLPGASSSTQSTHPVDRDQEIPVAFSPGQDGRENPHGGTSSNMNLHNFDIADTSSQAQLAVWRRIFLQSGIGLAIWALATLPLGKWGLFPLAAFPAALSILACLFSLGSPNRGDWRLAAAAVGTATLALAFALAF